MTEPRVRREVVLDATAEEVWRALTDEAELSAWFGAVVRLQPVPGGGGVFDEGDVVRHAVVEEVDEERRLVLRWSAPGEQESRVVFTIGDGDEGTRLTVEETPVVASASASTSSAWAMRLAGLQLRFALQPVTC